MLLNALLNMNAHLNVPGEDVKQSLCAELSRIHDTLMSQPSKRSVSLALDFLLQYRMALTTAFEMGAWTFAMCQQEPSVSWQEMFERVVASLSGVLKAPTKDAWQRTHATWNKFYLGVSSGGCARLPDGDVGARYVIRPSPASSPYNGQLFCVPTQTPALLTERSYTNRMQCELALSLLPRGNVASMDSVYCNEYGCSRVPQWSNTPQFGLTCGGGPGTCCGSGRTEEPVVYRNYPYMG